ncbi:hypothetical protein CBQ28_07925 [Pseudoalteromonas sp. GCY]|nr:hypothetical protein CBQ28_07925 [Pseudoalteromonas sp. GCY]
MGGAIECSILISHFYSGFFDNMSVHLEPVVNCTIIDDNRLFLGLLQLHQAMEQASFTLTKE